MVLNKEYLEEVRAAAEEQRRLALAKVHQSDGAIAMVNMLMAQLEDPEEIKG